MEATSCISYRTSSTQTSQTEQRRQYAWLYSSMQDGQLIKRFLTLMLRNGLRI